MVTPDRRRVAVARLQERFGVSERRACRVVGQHRSTQRRPKAPPSANEVHLREQLRDFARIHPRLGWRKAHVVACREGLVTNPKRTRRIWRDEGLQRPPQRKAKRLGSPTGLRRGCAPGARMTCGRWISSSTRPPICAASSCSTSSTSSPGRPSPSKPPIASTPTASSPPSSASSPGGARRRTCAWTTAPNSSPQPCGTGAESGAPTPPTLNPARPGRPLHRVLQRPPPLRVPQHRGLRNILEARAVLEGWRTPVTQEPEPLLPSYPNPSKNCHTPTGVNASNITGDNTTPPVDRVGKIVGRAAERPPNCAATWGFAARSSPLTGRPPRDASSCQSSGSFGWSATTSGHTASSVSRSSSHIPPRPSPLCSRLVIGHSVRCTTPSVRGSRTRRNRNRAADSVSRNRPGVPHRSIA